MDVDRPDTTGCVNWDTSVVGFSEAMPGRVGRGPNRSSPDGATASSGELSFGSIVHVNEKGGSFGGTEEYLSLVTSELSRRGVCSHLVCGVLGGTGPLEFDSVHVVEGLASREPLLRVGYAPGMGLLLDRFLPMLDGDTVVAIGH